MRILFLIFILFSGIAQANTEISTPGTNLGIGTTDTSNALGIASTLAVGGTSYTQTAAPANGVIIQGNVGIGSTNPGSKLDVSGTVRATNMVDTGVTASKVVVTNSSQQFTAATNLTDTAYSTAVGANPTASVSTSAVNGSSANFMRADGAPAIDQTMVPTWTGKHIFNATPIALTTGSGNVGIGSATPGKTLDVNGTIRVTGFALTTGAASNYILVGDSSGNGTWQAASSTNVGIGTSGTVTYWGASNTLKSSNNLLYYDAAIPQAAQPTLATVGSAGSTSYSYVVVPMGNLGYGLPSTYKTIATGNATLDGTNYITVATAAVTGSTSCDIYRGLNNFLTSGLMYIIAHVSCGATYSDQGSYGTPTNDSQPLAQYDASAGVLVGQNMKVNGLVSIGTAGVGKGINSGIDSGQASLSIVQANTNSGVPMSDPVGIYLNQTNTPTTVGGIQQSRTIDAISYIPTTATKTVLEQQGIESNVSADGSGSINILDGFTSLPSLGGDIIANDSEGPSFPAIVAYRGVNTVGTSRTVTNQTGLAISIVSVGIGTIARGDGLRVYSWGDILGTGKYTNLNGLYIDTPGAGQVPSNATNYTGINVEDGHAVGTSTSYGLYIHGSAWKSIFDGSVGIGTINPGTPLDVQGTIRLTAFKMPTGASNGYVLTSDANGAGTWGAAGGTGTVTTVSVATANGFAGTVANATTTPAITMQTSVTGLLKGNGTAVSAAASGTDYAPATSGTTMLFGNGSGGFTGVANTATSSGNVGIGSTAPGQALDVQGTIRVIGSASQLLIPSGNVGIASSSPGQVLDVQGTVRTTGFTLNLNNGAGYVMVGSSIGVGTWLPVSTLNFPTFNQNTTGNAATVTTNANLTGPITSVGNATSIASQTGTGTTFVTQASPTLTTPVLGVATGTSLTTSGNVGIGTSIISTAALTVMNGNVGIGTWIPSDTFQVGNGTSGANLGLIVHSNGNVSIGTTISTNWLTIGSNGNQITTGTSGQLTSANAITATQGFVTSIGGAALTASGANPTIKGTSATAGSTLTILGGGSTTSGLKLQDANVTSTTGSRVDIAVGNVGVGTLTALSVINGGNVGIGSVNPIFPLQIIGNVGMGTTTVGSTPYNLLLNNSATFNSEFQIAANIGVGTTTVNWNNGSYQNVGIGTSQGAYLAFTHPTNGSLAKLQLRIKQDATGSRIVNFWPSTVLWPGGTAPTLTTTAAKSDIINCTWNGTSDYCQSALNF